MAPPRWALLLLALPAAAAGVEEEAAAVWGDITVQESKANATAVLHVQNRAAFPVRLMGCGGTEVQAGENITLPLAGLSRFWLVPENATMDCHSGPFDDLFYFAADFMGPKPVVSVGYTVANDRPGAAGEGPGGAGQHAGPELSNSSIAGVELAAGPVSAANATVRCRAGACDRSLETPTMPDEFAITIVGPQSSLLSFWHGHGWGWGGGWGHHHHHHHHHHGWGYR